jgi:hypothetical protein
MEQSIRTIRSRAQASMHLVLTLALVTACTVNVALLYSRF